MQRVTRDTRHATRGTRNVRGTQAGEKKIRSRPFGPIVVSNSALGGKTRGMEEGLDMNSENTNKDGKYKMG